MQQRTPDTFNQHEGHSKSSRGGGSDDETEPANRTLSEVLVDEMFESNRRRRQQEAQKGAAKAQKGAAKAQKGNVQPTMKEKTAVRAQQTVLEPWIPVSI
jgi:hypothetical protein